MKKRKHFIALGALLLMLPLAAQAQHLVLTLADGTVSRFALTEAPVITYSENNMVVTCGNQTLTTSMADIQDCTYDNEVTAIQPPTVQGGEPRPTFNFGRVGFEGLQPAAPVTVYSLDGRTVVATKADAEGRVSMDLTTQPKGVYIIRTTNKSFKIKN